MFRFQHGCHFFQVAAVTVLIQMGQEEDRDDSLSDVDEVKIILALHYSVHHSFHTATPLTNT